MTAAQQGTVRPANLLDFGAVRNGPAESSGATSIALNAFGRWARLESAAGRAVHVVAPPGVYHFDQVLAADALKGIAKLVFSAHGATFLQTNPKAFPWLVGCDTLLYRNKVNPRIRAARRGATSVTAFKPLDLAQYAPGEMVMIAGQDIQYGGYPPNLYCFDFVRVKTADPRSGTMTFDPPLSHEYLTSFGAYGGSNDWAGSRIYKLDRNGFTWDIDHSFEGLTCRHADKAHSNYIIGMGRKLTFRDCDTPGFAESICEDFLAERCIERFHTEPDKLVKRSIRRHGDLRAGYGLQSASVDLAVIEDCKVDLVAVGAKRMIARNCTIDRVGFGGLLGFCEDATFENCRIGSAPYFFPYMPAGSRYNFVDGLNVTYTGGTFTVLKNALSGLAVGGGLANWNMIPGQAIAFCRGNPGDTSAAGSYIGSEIGAGIVTAVEDRPDSIVIATTLKAPRVPAWSSGQVFVKRRNPPVMRNCTGAEPARLASEASRAGKTFGEYFRYLFTGKTLTQGPVLAGRTGRLVRLHANVIKPAARPGAKLTLGELAAYRASTMRDPRHYQIDIDLTIAGQREFTPKSMRGAVGGDRVLYDNAPQRTLPADLWCENGMPNLYCSGGPFPLASAPTFELIFEFDLGLLGRRTRITVPA